MMKTGTTETSTESEKKIRIMIRRRITGIMLAALFLILWILQGWAMRVGFAIMLLISMWEVYDAFRAKGARPIRWVGMVYALLSLPAYMAFGGRAQMPLLALGCMLGMAGVILRGQIELDSVISTVFPMFYPGALVPLCFPLVDIEPPLVRTVALGLMFLVAVFNDLFAYEVGMRFGRHPLLPALSPKKTVEGAVAGVVGSLLLALAMPFAAQFVVAYIPFFAPYAAPLPPLWFFALLGIVGGLAAPLGDLTASFIKRGCGIKDFGDIFPGHGGMLDRVDSILFTGVVVHVFFFLAGYQ